MLHMVHHRLETRLVIALSLLLLGLPPMVKPAHSQSLLQKQKAPSRAEESVLVKIDRAHAAGRISLDEWALYTAYALFEPARLPDAFHGKGPKGCGTPLRNRFFQIWHQLSADTRRQLTDYGFLPNGALARPKGLDSTRTTAHFKIHYSVAAGDTNAVDSTDANKNGTPDYIEMVMRLLEEVYTTQIDTMGYFAPPPDTLENGKAYYDVYIYKLDEGVYGYVQSEKVVGDNPNSGNLKEKNAAYSYMALRNNYTGFDGDAERNLKVTIAHEFYHALQNGYDVYEKAWLSEATATWVEDELYDDINDNYQYLPDWFKRPWIALDATPTEADPDENHWYGSWIFFRFLSERVNDAAIVRKVWEHSVSYNSKTGDFSFNAIRDAIRDYNKTFFEMFTDFHVANLLKTLPPYQYEEGDQYPDIYRSQVFEPQFQTETYNMRYSADFYEVWLPFESDPDDEIEIKAKILDSLATFTLQVVEVTNKQVKVTKINPRQQPSHTVQDPGRLDKLYVIMVNMDAKGKNNRYRLEIRRKVKLTRLVFGYFIDKNKHYLVTRVSDTLRIISTNGTSRFTKINDFKLSPTEKLIAMKTNNNGDELIRILYNWKWVQIVPDSNLELSNISQFQEIAGVDGNQVWLAGPTIYRAFPVNDQRFRLVVVSDSGFGSLSYRRDEEKLKVSSGMAVWMDAYFRYANDGSYIFHSDFWQYSSQGVRKVKRLQTSIAGQIIYEWDFRDSLLVMYSSDVQDQNLSYVSFMNFRTGQQDTMNVSGSGLVKAFGQTFAWTEGRSVFYWDGRQVIQLYQETPMEALVGAYHSWLDLDSSGVAWMALESFNNALIPTFYFYKFEDRRIYSAQLDEINMYRDPTATHRGDRAILRDGTIYFTAMEVGAATQWPSVYALQLRDLLPTGLTQNPRRPPQTFELKPNYPNPFRDRTVLRFVLPQTSPVEITVYDILGRQVYSAVREKMPAGEHRFAIKTANWGSGVYFYRVKVGTVIRSGKMILVR